jgi:hypothetical protein
VVSRNSVDLLTEIAGTRVASAVDVRVPLVARIIVILTPLTITAARLHAHTVVDAVDATQEMNRCLRLVNVAAGKRQSSRGSHDPAAAASRRAARVKPE